MEGRHGDCGTDREHTIVGIRVLDSADIGARELMKNLAVIDRDKFGPWAVVTGASSGIGKEFARQLAANGLNLVLVARRAELLKEIGARLEEDFGIKTKTVQVDLAEKDFIEKINAPTSALDIGLVVSNAGAGNPGPFMSKEMTDLLMHVRLNATAHLELVHHFAPSLAKRRKGGILLVGAMGASNGIPYMANDSATKAYVSALGEALHVEFIELGINVTVLHVGLTDTPVIAKFGLDPKSMPMKPMSVEQCVSEGLFALQKNQSACIPGRLNRVMNRVVPPSITRKMMAKMLRR